MADISARPRLHSRCSFPELCLLRTALTTRVPRWTTLRAEFVSLVHAILHAIQDLDALVLAEGSRERGRERGQRSGAWANGPLDKGGV